MKSRLLPVFLSFLFLFSFAHAQIGAPVTTGNAESRLVAEDEAAVPGQIVTVALMQTLREGWHVYWQNPGDSGLPLTLNWTLPEGFEAVAPLYPLPHRLPLGPLVNYGHEGEPIFLIDIAVPESAVPGDVAELAVDASWLICADVCVPEDARLTLTLPIAAARGAGNGRYSVEIDRARRSQPRKADFEAVYYHTDRGPALRLTGAPEGKLEFYPYAPSLVEPSGATVERQDGEDIYLGMQAGFAYRARQPESLAGVLTVETANSRRGYEVFAPKIDQPAGALDLTPINTNAQPEMPGAEGPGLPLEADSGSPLLLPTLLLAFLGGIILNVMPCVFPIVFLKAAGFAAVAKEDRQVIRLHGILYTAGILVAFAGLAGLLIGLRAGGEQLGWGFHLQSPIAIAVFAIVLFLIGLNLFGLFEVGSSVQGVGNSLASKGGAVGAFFTGLLAVAVAAPCIGPLLGGAVGLALSQSALTGLLIFLAIGLGLAFPYLLLSLIPAAASILPRPGPWMVTLRQLFAFAMFATVIWLVWVLSMQAGPSGILKLGLAMLAASFGAWIFGRVQRGQSGLVGRIAAAAMLILAVIPLSRITTAEAGTSSLSSLGVVETAVWSEATLAEYRAAGTPVFVDFTAAWCITCQVNKQTVLNTSRVKQAFIENNVVYMVADWTNRDDEITAALEALGRAGVPVYLYYAPNAEAPIILPQLLSTKGVIGVIEGS
ncbi:protein-disulfide reductase DsbD family protein [Parvularcula marina]|nr:thioredoxin family protein [Parvularcula marina]